MAILAENLKSKHLAKTCLAQIEPKHMTHELWFNPTLAYLRLTALDDLAHPLLNHGEISFLRSKQSLVVKTEVAAGGSHWGDFHFPYFVNTAPKRCQGLIKEKILDTGLHYATRAQNHFAETAFPY